MKLTEQLEEIARQVANRMDDEMGLGRCTSDEWPVEFAARFLAALPKPEPVAHQFQARNGKWCDFMNQKHYENTVADGSWLIRPLYTIPPQPDAASLIDIYDQLWGGKREASSDKDVLRRISERGLKLAQEKGTEFIDLFQHLLDEIARLGDIASIGAEKVIQLSEPQPDDVRDAERYRWLCDQFWVEEEATFRLSLPVTDSATVYHDAINAAIDAAIAAEKGEV